MQIKTEADLDRLLEQLTQRAPKTKAVAAFDADGTLWDIDMGETFFHYVIQKQLVPLPPNPWRFYFELQDRASKEAAYLWLAQIFKGVPLHQVRQWAKESVEAAQPVPVFSCQKKVISHLLSLGVDVFIVTASIKWAVEPAAHLVGLPPEKVLGIETCLVDDRVGMQQKGLLTYRKGKLDRLLQETKGQPPFFCSGNTEGDLELLKGATDLRFVMSNTPAAHPNHETESRMVEWAKKEGWFYKMAEFALV